MIRAKKQKRKICKCHNCGYDITISPDTVKEKTFGVVIATKGVKLEMMQMSGKKLSPSQKKRLQSIETMLYNKRKLLKELYWDETYQSLNQYEEAQTGMADLEPTQGDIGVSLRPITSGERMNEHETE